MSKLSGSTDSPNDPPRLVNFELGLDDVDTNLFNPLRQFDQIGKKKLDQVSWYFLNSSSEFLIVDLLFIQLSETSISSGF